ncbi:C-5 cytosine methyltransferase, partial [Penicillium taxi]|uniref:C-5 cytosine methyltransferase n=1 Tax=Penicillium taxi TaxID=168475 RepID=UPI0025455A48
MSNTDMKRAESPGLICPSVEHQELDEIPDESSQETGMKRAGSPGLTNPRIKRKEVDDSPVEPLSGGEEMDLKPLSGGIKTECLLSTDEPSHLPINASDPLSSDAENEEAKGGSHGACDFPRESTRNLNADLPPMHKLLDIFQDIAERSMVRGFGTVINAIGGRRLRVATVCSGTESPLLALSMFKKGLTAIGMQFPIEHVFSCEIVPLKQAYIERNFSPPLIFRDVRELGGDQAQTAYGAFEVVPKDVDVIIGGTACVDFSCLNNNKKTLDQRGESGATFQGVLDYSKNYRPRIVVLENVAGAPWSQFEMAWLTISYVSSWVRVDSKQFYIPHTRVRGYMVCVDQERLERTGDSGAIDASDRFKTKFQELVLQFHRPASSPASSFMLDEHSTEYEELVRTTMARSGASPNSSDVLWTAYQKRHVEYREANELGNERPISRSRPGCLSSQFPDWFNIWAAGQPERVRETIDLKWLYSRKHVYVDIFYKEKFIDLSQGVDRSPESFVFGVVGCLTPHGLPFLTSRASPIFGTEALALQGIPNTVLLTRETQKEIQDLAGNAMTSPVVASIIICGLIAGVEVFGDPRDAERSAPPVYQPSPPLIYSVDNTYKLASCEPNEAYCFLDVDSSASLVEKAVAAAQMKSLILRARLSAQFCACEHQLGSQTRLLQCTICDFLACSTCAGNPTHAYKPLRIQERQSPHEFICSLKQNFPMKLRLSDLAHPGVLTPGINFLVNTFIDQLTADNGVHRTIPRTTQEQAVNIAHKAFFDEFCFQKVRRTKVWTVFYEGEFSHLHLEIGFDKLQWTLYPKIPKSITGSDMLRVIFAKPIARMVPKSCIYEGDWQTSSPLSIGFYLTIAGSGHAVTSYEAECGLPESEGVSEKIWSEIIVGSSSHSNHNPVCGFWGPYSSVMNDLDVDIRGTYTRIPNCGMALASLYKMDLAAKKREFAPWGCHGMTLSTQERVHAFEEKYPLSKSMDWVYLFFDPQKIGNSLNDHFSFSFEHHPLTGHEQRKAIAALTDEFKPHYLVHKTANSHKTFAGYFRRFKTCRDAKIAPCVVPPEEQHTYATLPGNVKISVRASDCKASYIPLLCMNFTGLAPDGSEYIDPAKSTQALEEWGLKWAMQKNSEMMHLSAWKDLDLAMDLPINGSICQSCDPLPPKMLWGRNAANAVTPYEDPEGAAKFERSIKTRTPPFLVFIGHKVEFALNVQSMAHRAYGHLVNTGYNTDVRFQWRLLTNTFDSGPKPRNTFIIFDNSKDVMSEQPPGFHLDMRPEQLRSLSWMVSQEREDIESFLEMEVEEARFPEVSWQAEVKVTMPRKIRGGLCADEVGYGKTVTILGLVDTQFDADQKRMKEEITDSHFIQSKATLIVIPSNVFKQWTEETFKFLRKKYKTLEIKNVKQLQTCSVSDIQEADIVFLSWAVLESDRYYEAMQHFTASPRAPKSGRQFDQWFDESKRSLRELIHNLNEYGPESLPKDVEERQQRLDEDQANSRYTPSFRLRGAKFAAAQEKENLSVIPEKDEKVNKKGGKQKKEDRKPLTSTEYRKKFNVGPEASSMIFPLLHSFHFNRIVVDEYTYAGEVRQLPLVELSGRSKWILSGTPSPCEFADIKSIARQLGVHLGIDDDSNVATNNSRLKAIRKQMTAVESFLLYKRACSDPWYEARHEHAQKFLDQFARQNKADTGEIPFKSHYGVAVMNDREKYIYGLLHSHFANNDGIKTRVQGFTNNRTILEINTRIKSSKSPIEALVQFGLTPCHGLRSSSKLDSIVKIIKSTPKEDQVIVFVQFMDLIDSVSSSLTKAGIENRAAKLSRLASTTEFIDSSSGKSSPFVKVLILPLGNVMAAGLNLQCANHVIFISPLVVSEIHEYGSGMTQAIGRVRRYGQKKTVHCHLMMTAHTADVNVFEDMNNVRVYLNSIDNLVMALHVP